MFSYVKALVSRVVLGPSDKDEIQKKKENGNSRDIWSEQDTREMIQLMKFTSGDPGSQGLDIFVEVGTIEEENTAEESDEAEEVTEDTSKKEKEEGAQDREVSWKLSEHKSMRRKRLRRMSPVDEKDVATVKEVVAEQLEAEGEIHQDEQDSMCRPNKLEINSGSINVVDNILILSSPDPDSSPSPSPECAAGQKSPISDSDPVAELFPVKVKRSFTLRPTLRSLNR